MALRKTLYSHPLIKSLYTTSALKRLGRSEGPSYIPSPQFALALLDVVTGNNMPTAADPGGRSPVAQLRDAIANNAALPASLKDALRVLIADAGDDMEKVKTNLQQWFDGSMDRVAGWYKRRAQFVLLVVGVLTAVLVNADTLVIIRTLSNDSAVRQAVVTAADTYIRENSKLPPADGTKPAAQSLDAVTNEVRKSVDTVSKQLGTLGLPVGWRQIDRSKNPDYIKAKNGGDPRPLLIESRVWPGEDDWKDEWWAQLDTHLFGWLLTALALSLGAPFWFDTLNKIMVIRSTVKPREKSREEVSEDRK